MFSFFKPKPATPQEPGRVVGHEVHVHVRAGYADRARNVARKERLEYAITATEGYVLEGRFTADEMAPRLAGLRAELAAIETTLKEKATD